ncbi:hypothetical protein ACQ4PT_055041 [Festuca glaucescens]
MPCQGHVTPLMELSHRLVDHGFEVTFVNTKVDHALVLAALPDGDATSEELRAIHLEYFPDGLADDEDRKDLNKLIDAYSRHMPGYLEELIGEIEAAGQPKVKWLVGDVNMGWSFVVAKKLGIRIASFWPASATILPIGPLFADSKFQKPVGSFLWEDERCLKWLDACPDGSIVYVVFSGLAIFDPRQFQELAEGLELTGRPFLWVVRPADFTAGPSKEWLHNFWQCVAGTGMIVSWCSQQQVLAHRAVACFVSHCGWNSTLEAAWNGVRSCLLALLLRPVPRSELRHRRVEDRSRRVDGRRWRRRQGGGEEQGGEGHRRCRIQEEGRVAEGHSLGASM